MGKLIIEIDNEDTIYSLDSIRVQKNGMLYAEPNPNSSLPPIHRRIEYHTRNGRKKKIGYLANSSGTEKTIFELQEP